MKQRTLVLLALVASVLSAPLRAAEGNDAADVQTVPLPVAGSVLEIRATCGEVGGGVDIGFLTGGKSPVTLKLRAVDMPELRHHWGMSKLPAELKDAAVDIRLSGALGDGRRAVTKTYFIRPDCHFYFGKDLGRALAEHDGLPKASNHEFLLRLVAKDDKVEIWLDGHYFTHFAKQAIAEVSITATAGGRVIDVTQSADPESTRFLPLDLAVHPHRPVAPLSSVSVASGVGTIGGIPLDVLGASNTVDVGFARWLRQEEDSQSFYDAYYKRSGWDSLPETIIFNVPKRFYNYAHILCLAVPGGERKPEMSVRVARYRQAWDGSGATQADTDVALPPGEARGCTSVNEVGTADVVLDGKTVSVPLLLVEIPLKTGELAGVLQMQGMDWGETTDYLYLEFTRTLRTRVTINEGLFEKKPLGPRSGIHILGVTLEKAPVDVLVLSDRLANVFEGEKNPALRIDSENGEDGPRDLALEAAFTDFDGQVRRVNRKLTFRPGSASAPFPLDGFALGWYSARFTFSDAAGRTVWDQPLTLALLPPDTRQAGAESPYGTWWFAGSHYSEPHADRVMPLFEKMGFRHTTPPRADPKMGRTHENLLRYKVTPSMMRRLRTKDATAEDVARKFMQDWPDTRYAMIFHETGIPDLGIDLPAELLGKPVPALEGKALETRDALMEHIETHAAGIRAVAPDAKIILGNSSTPFNVQWLREGLDRKYWDALGMEMAVQKFCPEGQPTGWNLQGMWIAKRMRELYGYEDLPITSCYEFDYRPTAHGGLTLTRQAEWYARDVLHCLAYRMPNINVALIMDCNSSYYSSRWGSTGVCFRHPLMMPKPSYVALATLTRVLDQAEYQRYLDTGSHNLYCLEFKKGGGYVYALWTASGSRPVALVLPGAGAVTAVDLMGREQALPIEAGRVRTRVTTAPSWVVAAEPVTAVEAGTPDPVEPRLAGATVVASLAEPAGWQQVPSDAAFEDYCAYKPMAPGKITVSKGEDGFTLALAPQPELPDVMARYTVLEPRGGPIDVPGRPGSIGVWVKGNASWGRVYLEVLDARGRRWTSNGWEEAPHSWDMSDWQGDMCINFDGWSFISTGFPSHYASGYYGLDFHNWRCQGDNSKTNHLAYPLKLSRLYVTMREKLVYVTDMVPATSMDIALRDVTVFAEE